MHKIILYISLILFAIACPVFAAQNTPENDSAKIQTIMNTLVKPYLADKGIPGAAIAIRYHQHDYIFTYGMADVEKQVPVTKDTVFELASITKIFTTTLLALEVQKNTLKLSDPIVRYLPALAATRDLPIDQVKVINLATHTAGFPRAVEGFGIQQGDQTALMNTLQKWQADATQPIGKSYLYSNIGFGLLGLVVGNAAHSSYDQLLQEQVTRPLHMTNTVVTLPAAKAAFQAQGYNMKNNPSPFFVPTYLLGGGALRSSVADMLQFMKANLGIATGTASPALLSAMQLAQKPMFTVRPNFSMGLGWQQIVRQDQIYITKNGGNSGFSTFIGFSPSKKFGVVVLTNQRRAQANKLGNQLLKQLANLNA